MNAQYDEAAVRLVTQMVVDALLHGPSIPIGVSNRHIHLCRADMDILFGPESGLTRKKDLVQPGQYAAEETVTIRGPKGELQRVRVLGPLREETQVEISVTDGFLLGVRPPVRESGQLKESPGIELMGPRGAVKKAHGVLAALRHIHMSPADARRFGVADRDTVTVRVGDDRRGGTLDHVCVRVSDAYALEMHVDVDEANALGIATGDRAVLVR